MSKEKNKEEEKDLFIRGYFENLKVFAVMNNSIVYGHREDKTTLEIYKRDDWGNAATFPSTGLWDKLEDEFNMSDDEIKEFLKKSLREYMCYENIDKINRFYVEPA